MQGWQSEQQAQMQYGRSQAFAEEGIASRPFGSSYPRNVDNSNGGYIKPRQYGNPHRQNIERGVGQEQGVPSHPRPTGHMAFLKSLQRSEATVRIVTIHDDVVVGSVKDCDDVTLSLRVPCATEENPNAYQNRVFFKQNLVEFAPVIEGVTFS